MIWDALYQRFYTIMKAVLNKANETFLLKAKVRFQRIFLHGRHAQEAEWPAPRPSFALV